MRLVRSWDAAIRAIEGAYGIDPDALPPIPMLPWWRLILEYLP